MNDSRVERKMTKSEQMRKEREKTTKLNSKKRKRDEMNDSDDDMNDDSSNDNDQMNTSIISNAKLMQKSEEMKKRLQKKWSAKAK